MKKRRKNPDARQRRLEREDPFRASVERFRYGAVEADQTDPTGSVGYWIVFRGPDSGHMEADTIQIRAVLRLAAAQARRVVESLASELDRREGRGVELAEEIDRLNADIEILESPGRYLVHVEGSYFGAGGIHRTPQEYFTSLENSDGWRLRNNVQELVRRALDDTLALRESLAPLRAELAERRRAMENPRRRNAPKKGEFKLRCERCGASGRFRATRCCGWHTCQRCFGDMPMELPVGMGTPLCRWCVKHRERIRRMREEEGKFNPRSSDERARRAEREGDSYQVAMERWRSGEVVRPTSVGILSEPFVAWATAVWSFRDSEGPWSVVAMRYANREEAFVQVRRRIPDLPRSDPTGASSRPPAEAEIRYLHGLRGPWAPGDALWFARPDVQQGVASVATLGRPSPETERPGT